MMVMVLSNLEDKRENDRLWRAAKVEAIRSERGGNKILDLKISLDREDLLMRKLWKELEKFCKLEGVKRFQVEAKTVVSPVKNKPMTELEKVKERVKQILDQEKKARQDEIEKENTLVNENPPNPTASSFQLLALTDMDMEDSSQHEEGPVLSTDVEEQQSEVCNKEQLENKDKQASD